MLESLMKFLLTPLFRWESCFGPTLEELTCHSHPAAMMSSPLGIVVIVSLVGGTIGWDCYKQYKEKKRLRSLEDLR